MKFDKQDTKARCFLLFLPHFFIFRSYIFNFNVAINYDSSINHLRATIYPAPAFSLVFTALQNCLSHCLRLTHSSCFLPRKIRLEVDTILFTCYRISSLREFQKSQPWEADEVFQQFSSQNDQMKFFFLF